MWNLFVKKMFKNDLFCCLHRELSHKLMQLDLRITNKKDGKTDQSVPIQFFLGYLLKLITFSKSNTSNTNIS